MKHPITLILLFVMFQLSCSVDQNEVTLDEVTLDKMIGKWELISRLSKKYDGGIEETYFPDSTYIQLTIRKHSGNRGAWIEEEYRKSDSLLVSFPKSWNSLFIYDGGTKCQLSLISGSMLYTVYFEEQNLILDAFDNIQLVKKIYTPIE